MKIGLFFGSFNPVHVGHLLIANYMISFTDIDELWFMVSPQNPLKDKALLIDDSSRLEMLKIAVHENSKIKVSDVEFSLPTPSYTVHTLEFLEKHNPGNEFVIIMGADGLESFTKWKDYEKLQEKYQRYVYPRPGHESVKPGSCKNCQLQPAPLIEISSKFIRNALHQNKDMRYFLPEGVYDYIKSRKLYI
jgi:nicotinate-nucleotide adenylyltransferase